MKPVESEDYRALVDLVDEVEAAYCQRQQLDHLNILTMRDVDHISKFLPNHVRVKWIREYRDRPFPEKVKPFPHFIKFLELPLSGKQERYEVLKQVNVCFKCFGNHKKQECPKKDPCPTCGSQLHHVLLCKGNDPKEKTKNAPETEQPKTRDDSREETHNHMVQSH